MRGDHAWFVLVAGIAAYEAACVTTGQHDALLSRTLDRARGHHLVVDVACRAAVIATALHLCRWIPPRFDPFALVRLT